MLIIKNLSLYLKKDLRLLLEDFSFSLLPKQKAALIGEVLKDFKGGIIAISHDRKYISEVFDTVYQLDAQGLHEIHWQNAQN